LRNISNSLQFLKWDFGEQIEPKASEYIEFAINGSVRLTHMIQGLTNYANINNVLPFKKASTKKIIEETMENLKGLIEENEAVINTENLPEEIAVHKYQMIQLFQNLISNAIKFKKENVNPVINISYQSLEDEWEFSVADNGISVST
jgi:light-regulated signal transduction histidine kinase (bacteriophytochrome)